MKDDAAVGLYEDIRHYFQGFYKDIFPENTGQFERHFNDTIKLDASESQFETIRRITSISTDSRILDVGCGFGTFVLVCRKKGYQAYGVDTGKYEIKFAKKRILMTIPDLLKNVYQMGSAKSLPFHDKSFDIVTVWNLLEHVRDYKMVLNEVDRVLKKDGFIFLKSPNYLAIREEAHYHLLWLPLMPRKIARFYLKLRGRNPEFFMKNIYYVTNIGVSKHLKAMGYELGSDTVIKLQHPSLVVSKVKAKILKMVKRFKLEPMLRIWIFASYFNPFNGTIWVCARKGRSE